MSNNIIEIEKEIKKESENDKHKMIKSTCVYCAKEVVYFHGEKPDLCPHCGSDQYKKPPTETKLFLLQKKYLETKDQQYLTDMFKILKEYATSLTKKNLPKEFKYHYDKIEEKAVDAASLFLECYLAHSDFKVNTSFGGQLQYKVKEVLWDKKNQREEKHESLNKAVSHEDDFNESELINVPTSVKMKPLYGVPDDPTFDVEQKTSDLMSGIERIINSHLNDLKEKESNYFTLKVLLGICIIIEGRGDIDLDKFFYYFGSAVKEDVVHLKLLIYKYITE
jgi:hypothetical protein